MIEIEHLSKSFGRCVAVDNLSFSVSAGEVLGFLGPNGAGKSTTMRMLAGFVRPDAGSIRIFGEDISRSALRAKMRLGYLPEGAPSYIDMPVQGFLEFVAAARGIPARERGSSVAGVLGKLQLHDVRRRPIETLSKGYQRRVGLAQALLHDPDLLILDEPTDGLDPNQKHEVRELIRHLSSDKIVIISTHILEEVDAVCSRAIIINEGRLVADATPAQLKVNSDYYQSVELEVRGAAGLIESLRRLDGIRDILCSEATPDRLILLPYKNAAIWGVVSEFLQAREIDPVFIALSAGRLDDVFRRVTAEPANDRIELL